MISKTVACYGKKLTEIIPWIKRYKMNMAKNVSKLLRFEISYTVLENEMGAGLQSRNIAPPYRSFYGCEICEEFIKYAKKECSHCENASRHRYRIEN